MKISELTAKVVKDFTGISDDDSDDIVGNLLMPAAKAYIKEYTGLTDEELDKYEDLAIAYCVLVNEWYSQREYTSSIHRQVSPTIKSILSAHAVNHLG